MRPLEPGQIRDSLWLHSELVTVPGFLPASPGLFPLRTVCGPRVCIGSLAESNNVSRRSCTCPHLWLPGRFCKAEWMTQCRLRVGWRTSAALPTLPDSGPVRHPRSKGMRGIQAKSREVSQEGEQGLLDGTQTQQLQLWGSVTYRLGQFGMKLEESLIHSCHSSFVE